MTAGRIKHNGYILVLDPKHPFANGDGYVREHRLVMEQAVGQYLDPKIWDVHHINNIKDDNTLGNLQLIPKKEHSRLSGKRNWLNPEYADRIKSMTVNQIRNNQGRWIDRDARPGS